MVASGKESRERQLWREASVSPLATKAISRARPPAVPTDFSIGAGLCSELFDAFIVPSLRAAGTRWLLLRLYRYGSGTVENLDRWLLGGNCLGGWHSVAQCWRDIACPSRFNAVRPRYLGFCYRGDTGGGTRAAQGKRQF